MSTKKKTASKPTKNNKASVSKITNSLLGQILAPNRAIVELANEAIASLKRMVNGTGNFQDWMKVLHRITVGSYMLDGYFKNDPEAKKAFNQAWVAIVIVKLRVHCTGEFGVLVKEYDSISLAMALADEMCRVLPLADVRKVYMTTDDYYEELVRDNIKLYPSNWKEVEAMEKKLAAEYAEVREIDPLKEAA